MFAVSINCLFKCSIVENVLLFTESPMEAMQRDQSADSSAASRGALAPALALAALLRRAVRAT